LLTTWVLIIDKGPLEGGSNGKEGGKSPSKSGAGKPMGKGGTENRR